jgi:hypothetical protein
VQSEFTNNLIAFLASTVAPSRIVESLSRDVEERSSEIVCVHWRKRQMEGYSIVPRSHSEAVTFNVQSRASRIPACQRN